MDTTSIKILCLILFFALPGFAAHAQEQIIPKASNPPFEIWIPTLDEAGNRFLHIRYHADGTFEQNSMPIQGMDPYLTNHNQPSFSRAEITGRWWWEGQSFCWHNNKPGAREKVCKTNGHYIGRTPIVTEMAK